MVRQLKAVLDCSTVRSGLSKECASNSYPLPSPAYTCICLHLHPVRIISRILVPWNLRIPSRSPCHPEQERPMFILGAAVSMHTGCTLHLIVWVFLDNPQLRYEAVQKTKSDQSHQLDDPSGEQIWLALSMRPFANCES